jgi:hypothetical protein
LGARSKSERFILVIVRAVRKTERVIFECRVQPLMPCHGKPVSYLPRANRKALVDNSTVGCCYLTAGGGTGPNAKVGLTSELGQDFRGGDVILPILLLCPLYLTRSSTCFSPSLRLLYKSC